MLPVQKFSTRDTVFLYTQLAGFISDWQLIDVYDFGYYENQTIFKTPRAVVDCSLEVTVKILGKCNP